jgi:hypothetical protein
MRQADAVRWMLLVGLAGCALEQVDPSQPIVFAPSADLDLTNRRAIELAGERWNLELSRMRHEIGHGLGLHHIEAEFSVMGPGSMSLYGLDGAYLTSLIGRTGQGRARSSR